MMRWKSLLAASAMAILGQAQAQPPGAPVSPPRVEGPSRADPALEAWIDTLSTKIADRHDGLRHSSRVALIEIGQPALPVLKKISEGSDLAAD